MQDRQHPDALDREEAASREVIAALGQLGRDVEAPPDFVARVLAQADHHPAPRPPRRAWLGRLPWGVDVAVAALLVLAFVGAVPQYVTWFHAYVRGVPPAEDEPIGPLRTRGPGRERAAFSLPLGTWEVNASGDRGPLQLVSVSPQGELRGTLFGTEIVGFWDERAQKVMFVRLLNPADPVHGAALYRLPVPDSRGAPRASARRPTPSPARLPPWPARASPPRGQAMAGMRSRG